MDKGDKEINIAITTTHDAEGLEDAKRGIDDLAAAQAEQEKESAAAAQDLTGARKEMSAASEEAAKKEEAMSLYMALANKTIKQLRAEVSRLNAEKKKAAAAGDARAYKELSTQYTATKKALAELTAQQNLAKTATMSQVQVGMQFAEGLQRLGSQVKSGSTDIAGLATQVMALGTALKAGLGPIGWVMVGLQGLTAIIEMCGDKTEELGKKQAETARKQAEVAQAMQAAGRAMAEAMLTPLEREAKEEERLRKDAQTREQNALKNKQALAEQERRQELTDIQNQYDKETALLKTKIAKQAEEDAKQYGEGAAKTQAMRQLEEELYKIQKEYNEKIRKLESDGAVAVAKEQQAIAEQRSRQLDADIAATKEQLKELEAVATPEELQVLENPLLQQMLDELVEYKADLQSAEATLKQAEQAREDKGVTLGDRAEAAWNTAAAAQQSALGELLAAVKAREGIDGEMLSLMNSLVKNEISHREKTKKDIEEIRGEIKKMQRL